MNPEDKSKFLRVLFIIVAICCAISFIRAINNDVIVIEGGARLRAPIRDVRQLPEQQHQNKQQQVQQQQQEEHAPLANKQFEGFNEAQGQSEEVTGPIYPGLPDNFYVKGDRYTTPNNGATKSIRSPCVNSPNSACQNSCNWSVPYEAGANNTFSDILWHYMEPRMVLQDNCMRCGTFSKQGSGNAPNGLTSDYTSHFDNSVENGVRNVHGLLYDEVDVPEFGIDYPHTMSPKASTGTFTMTNDCALDKAISSSKCGCDGFGKEYKYLTPE